VQYFQRKCIVRPEHSILKQFDILYTLIYVYVLCIPKSVLTMIYFLFIEIVVVFFHLYLNAITIDYKYINKITIHVYQFVYNNNNIFTLFKYKDKTRKRLSDTLNNIKICKLFLQFVFFLKYIVRVNLC